MVHGTVPACCPIVRRPLSNTEERVNFLKFRSALLLPVLFPLQRPLQMSEPLLSPSLPSLPGALLTTGQLWFAGCTSSPSSGEPWGTCACTIHAMVPLTWHLHPEGRFTWCLEGVERVWAGQSTLPSADERTCQTHRPASTVSPHVTVDLEASWVVRGKDRVDTVILLSTQENIQAVPGPRACDRKPHQGDGRPDTTVLSSLPPKRSRLSLTRLST